MADKVARRGVSIYIDGSKVINSVKGIKSEMAKLTNEQAKMVYMSDEYIAHARKIAQLDNILQQHKDYQKEITKEYGKMSGAADDFEKKSKKAFSLDSIASGINKLKGAIIGFIASFTVDKAIDEFSKLDDAQANVQKYTGLTRAEIKELNKDFDSLDTRTARIRLNELAGDAGRLGIQSRKDILDFVDAANIIDVALGEDLGEGAIKSIGKLAQMFGDADRMGLKQAMLATGSAINEVAQNSSAAEPYLVDFTNRLSGVGNQAGFSISQIIGLGSVLDQNAQQVETSATALSGLIMKIYQEPAKFAKIAGLDVKKFADMMKKDANEALLTLLDTLGKQGGLDKLAPIFKDMNLNGARSSSILSVLAGNIEQVRKEQKTATDAFAEGKSVMNEYDVQNNTFSANMEKQKNVLLGYITNIGEKLAPMVLEGASAGNMLLKVFTSLITILIDNKEAVLTVVGAYLAYNVALKAQIAYQTAYNAIATVARLITLANAGAKAIETGNTIRAAAAQKLYYTTLEKGGAVTKAYIAVTSLLAAAKALLTGNLVAARAAMIQFNTVVAANPVGAFLVVIGALVAAFGYLYSKTKDVMTAQKAVKEATEELNSELGKEISQSNRLFEALKRANPESEEYRRLKDQIIKLYGPYLKGLIDEKGNLIDIARAQAEVNNKIRENISLKIKNAATDKIQEASVKEQISDLDEVMDIVEKQMKRSTGYNKEAANVVRENINKAINEAVANGKTGMVELTDAIQEVLKGENLDMRERFGFWEPKSLYMATASLASGVYRAQNEIKKVEDQFKGMISDATELDSLLSGGGDTDPDTGGDGGSGGSGDKTSVQRKKINDALRTLEEQHLKDMSEIKAKYLSGDIKTEEEYNQEILKQQYIYDQERKKKLQDLLKSITDPSLRIDIAKQIADIDAKAYDRQISDMEKRRKALAKWNDEETKKIVQAALKDVDAQESKAEQELAMLRAKNEISDAEYRNRLLENEKKYLEERLRINGLTEEEIAKIRQQLDKNSGEQDINKADTRTSALDKYGLVSLESQKEQELALIKYYEDQGILTHEEAIKARIQADQNYLDGLTAKVSEVNEKIQMIGGNLTGAMTNFASAEESAISRKYDKQIAAAEGNSKKQKKLEEKKQKELNAVKAKYADKQFAVTVAQTISTTALAAMEAYKAMAGIPIVGPALGAIAAGAAIAYGASQIAVAKEQRDAAKEGYYQGGYYIDEGYTGGGDPKQVRGYLPDGSPVHGKEFIANHATTSLFSPLFDIFDEAQKHNTVSSISKRDLAKALNIPTGYYQGGYNGSSPSSSTVIRDSRYDEVYERFTDVLERLKEKMDVPFKGYVTYKGDDGIEEAQNLDEKMMKNVSR